MSIQHQVQYGFNQQCQQLQILIQITHRLIRQLGTVTGTGFKPYHDLTAIFDLMFMFH